jgi:processing peptidase subunit alpha
MSSAQLISQIERIGGNFTTQTNREVSFYQCTLFKHDLSKLFPVLSAIISRPLYTQAEIDETKDTITYELQEMNRKWDTFLPDKLISTAYNNSSLGNSLYCDSDAINNISPQLLHRYRSTWFTPNRMVIAGVGVDHAVLEELAHKHFGDLPPVTPEIESYQKSLTQPAKYTGGFKFIDSSKLGIELHPDDMLLTHAYLGFESLNLTDPDIYALNTLASMLGGGGSFSAGGPGKGMYTRLYRQILNRYSHIITSS